MIIIIIIIMSSLGRECELGKVSLVMTARQKMINRDESELTLYSYVSSAV